MPSASSGTPKPSTSRGAGDGSDFTWIENLIGDNGDGTPAITKQMIIGGVSGWLAISVLNFSTRSTLTIVDRQMSEIITDAVCMYKV